MAALFGNLLILEALEVEENRRYQRVMKRMVRDAQNPFSLSESQFRQQFRLNKDAAMYLLRVLAPHLVEGVYTSKIPKMVRVLSVIHFYGVGSYQRGLANNFFTCISQSSLSRSITEVTDAILRHLTRRWIKFPRNDVERNVNKERFHAVFNMPEIIGVVDGTHIAIVKPRVDEHMFVNRKGYHSLNCQIICDADMKIINIVSQWPGSTHDAFIWRSSRIGRALRANYENGQRHDRIMGDSGYPCLPWLLVPFARTNTQRQEVFNNTFKQSRSVVERCIGLLKGRHRCLLKDRVLHYAPNKAARIVLACAILHNIAIHYRVPNPIPLWDEIDQEPLPQPLLDQQDLLLRNLGQQSREAYVDQYFNFVDNNIV
ncbi:putative nuclease HARBI1 [Photinus pyralis]|uniref:putative nuclease HARBI1 n=1 Tax=Photinus pyralis TaxID=7054 RepID=UPI001266EED5|nr:putative nuclease HARBI1 [Photinus pyralis]